MEQENDITQAEKKIRVRTMRGVCTACLTRHDSVIFEEVQMEWMRADAFLKKKRE